MPTTNFDVFTSAASQAQSSHARKMAGPSHARKNSVTMTISLTPQDRDDVRRLAAYLGMPVSVLLRICFREYVRNHDLEKV